MKNNYFATLLTACLLLCGTLRAQTLVESSDVPGVLIPEGYTLRAAITGLDYPSNFAAGAGSYWITESGFDPQIPPTVTEVTLPALDTGIATVILTPAMLPMGTLAPPFTDVVYHDSLLYLAHRQVGANGWLVGAYSRFSPDDPAGTFQTIITNLPSTGDHSNNTIVFGPDGRAYFGQGSATNSGVVGADNADWVAMAPQFSEIPPVDITLNDTTFTPRVPTMIDPDTNAVTAPYRAFDSGSIDSGLVVRAATPANPVNGIIAGSGTIYSFDAAATIDVAATLRLEAWGLRNPFGLAFDATDSTRLFVSNNGSDIRGSAGDPNNPLDPSTFVIEGNRPVAQDYDDLFVLTTGGDVEFFGWPEFFHDPQTNAVLGANDSLFCDNPALTTADCPDYIFDQSFRDSLTVQEAFAAVGPYVSVTGLTAAKTDSFGYSNNLFVTESGSFSPQTGAFTFTGYKVSRFDETTGEQFDFIVNEGSTPEELFVPTKFNKPVVTQFIGNQLAIVDLGVVEPGINLFQSGTGKVWLLSRDATTATTDLQRDFGASFGSVAPNPTSGLARVNLKLRESITGSVSVVDLYGRVVQTVYSGRLAVGETQFQLETSGLSNGTYVIRLTGRGGVLSQRFVVAR